MDAWFHRSEAISFEVVISSLLFKPDYTDRFHGNTQSPQHFSNPSKFFSASLMSWLIWSIPSSIRSSCSESYSVYKLIRPLIHFFSFPIFTLFYSTNGLECIEKYVQISINALNVNQSIYMYSNPKTYNYTR